MLLENRKNYFNNDKNQNQDKSVKSSNRYRYKVFGLHIESNILLPELLNALDTFDTPEVSIRFGKVPISITGAIERTKIYQVTKNQFLFQVPRVGSYYVTDGNSIVVEPAEQSEERFVRLFLLGTAFGSLLMQRGILPIHGSAVVINGNCLIITGVSGAGKSTLLAAFRKQGYSFLTDDVAAVTVDTDGVVWVHSAYPQQKLWRDSAEVMGVDTTSLSPVIIDIDKFAVPVHNGFWQSPVPLVAVYELEAKKCRDVTVKPLAGMDKLAVLMSHTYRPWLIEGLGLKAEHFKQCISVANKVAVACLTRPEGVFSLEEQVRLVRQDLTRCLADREL